MDLPSKRWDDYQRPLLHTSSGVDPSLKPALPFPALLRAREQGFLSAACIRQSVAQWATRVSGLPWCWVGSVLIPGDISFFDEQGS